MGKEMNEDIVQMPVVRESYDVEYSWWMRYMELGNMVILSSDRRLSEAEMREVVHKVLGMDSGVSRSRLAQVWASLKSKGWSDKKTEGLIAMRKGMRKGMKVVIPYLLEVGYDMDTFKK